MEQSASRNVARRTSLLIAALALSALSHAGDFSFTPGTWSNVTTTGTTSGLLYTPTSDPNTISSSLSLKALASGTYTVQGTWSFTAKWTPTTTGETPPANVQITLRRCGTLVSSGTGVARITSGTTDLAVVNAANLWEAGVTKYLPGVVLTLPLVSQPDGTYQASSTLNSDQIAVTYDSQTNSSTSSEESYLLSDIQGVN